MLDFIFEIVGAFLEDGIFEVVSYILVHLGRVAFEVVREIWAMF